MKNIILKLGSLISCLVLMITVSNVNQACTSWIHQPKLPQDAKSLRKF